MYSVPSRLIDEQVEARLYLNRVEVWYGQKKVAEMPRLRGRRKHRIDYRHIIDWLVRKPGAFANYRYRDELFPTTRFRMAFDALEARLGARSSREYLRILELAAKESEAKVDEALHRLLADGGALTANAVEEATRRDSPALREVRVAAVDLGRFDELYVTAEVLQNPVGSPRRASEGYRHSGRSRSPSFRVGRGCFPSRALRRFFL